MQKKQKSINIHLTSHAVIMLISSSMNKSAKLWVRLYYVIIVYTFIIRVGDVNNYYIIIIFVCHCRVSKLSHSSYVHYATFVYNTTLIIPIKIHYSSYTFTYAVYYLETYSICLVVKETTEYNMVSRITKYESSVCNNP